MKGNKQKFGRLFFRLAVLFYGLLFFIATISKKRSKPAEPKRFLIAHHLLLGDTLMLTAMLAHLRFRYPDAEINFLVPEAFADLYEKSPYGIRAIAYNQKSLTSYLKIKRLVGQVDIAYIPGDNRYSYLAYSLNSRWIVAFEDLPNNWLKSLPVDEFVTWPELASNWGDMNLSLIGHGLTKVERFYDKGHWPAPFFTEYQRPSSRYIILHVGASTPLKYWQAEKWLSLADRLGGLGFQVVLTSGRQERFIIDNIDSNCRFKAYSDLNLPQLWNLIENAEMLISPDTGVAHLAKLTDTPVVVLFGQGSDTLFGQGEFFKSHRYYRAVIERDIFCRDQNVLFKRPIPWVRRCNRSTKQCSDNQCMKQISVDKVYEAVLGFINLAH